MQPTPNTPQIVKPARIPSDPSDAPATPQGWDWNAFNTAVAQGLNADAAVKAATQNRRQEVGA